MLKYTGVYCNTSERVISDKKICNSKRVSQRKKLLMCANNLEKRVKFNFYT